MSDTASQGERHIEQGDLVRYLDGEMAGSERASVAKHLLGCRECSSFLDAMRIERRLLAEVMAQLEVPQISPRRREQTWAAIEKAASKRVVERQPRRWSAGLTAAAVAAGVMLTTFAVSPVRAFVTDLWTEVASRAGIVRVTVVEPEPIRVAGAIIGFVPTADSFVLEVRSTQVEGTLILGVTDGGSVNAQAQGGDQVVDIRILPGSGMRIENDQNETGSYAVNLPANLDEVRIRIGDQPEMVYDVDALKQSWVTVIDLTPGSVSTAAEPTR